MEVITRYLFGKKFYILLSVCVFLIFLFFFNYSPQEKLSPFKHPPILEVNLLELVTLPLHLRNDSADESVIFVSSKYESIAGSSNNESQIVVAGYNLDANAKENVTSLKLEQKNNNSIIDIMDKYRCKCEVKARTHERTTLLEQMTLINPLYNLSSGDVLRHQHPNIPLEMMTSLTACSSMPLLHNIKWNANYWQVFTSISGIRYHLYSAFYDSRLETDDAPVVHILTLKSSPENESLFCNVWFNANEGPVSTKITKLRHIDYQALAKNRLLPFLLTCPIPGKEMRVPIAVSLTDKSCGTFSNMLKVVGEQIRNHQKSVETKHNGVTQWRVGVCGPALYYFHNDISRKLVDWIETLRAIGVSKVHLYETETHPNIEKVLRYYESENFLETIKFSYPEPYINEPNLRRYWTEINRKAMFAMENIYFTDCVLRNKDSFRFLSHVDPDEMIIINDGKSLPEFMKFLLSQNELPKNPAAYQLFSTFYLENLPPDPEVSNLPEHLYILRHSMHYKNMTKHQSFGRVKSIYDTDYAEGIFSHGVLFCNRDPCRLKSKEVPRSLAHFAHIRSHCDDECQKKETFVSTKTLIKHKEMIQKNVENVLVTLGLL